MKPAAFNACLILLVLLLTGIDAFAQDMRALHVRARQEEQALLEKAAAEKAAAEQEAAESRARIFRDRQALQKAVSELAAQNRRLSESVKALETELTELEKKEAFLSRHLAEKEGMIRELLGVIRISAKDSAALFDQNPQAALSNHNDRILTAIAGQNRLPAMDDIRRMQARLLDESRQSGQVWLQEGPMIDRSGRQVQAPILMLGSFTAAYRNDGEIGFLNYSSTGRKLYALSRLPNRRMCKQLEDYMAGRSDAVPMDISRGGALRQLSHELTLWQQIPKGGPIVWPILAILALGILIVIERAVFLLRKRFDADGLLRRIGDLAACRQWEDCRQSCRRFTGKPVARVIAAGLDCRKMNREDMENALQEAILREVPAMERFLSTLGMLAAIAPLLGLLGTVTGMIDTFQVITHHGTGDPRMMSGGISEALVTTMLGLSVAIPLMLAHTLLHRGVDKLIGQMEEKAVAFVNIVHKNRGGA
jgi:biopolymer transport protein ExbB